ncbi:baculoviral IAP repeat-containing protein 6 isoform X3 [Aethina tumida]|uniref:baculoviral IAP repeat-containing protein 6 isoform X3 n=1 Tax=Aethina tumida TaxID=116153 RepID=UPI0021479035|nr:baculoviral IAP repeat-containing protein 6 isoform X3 [Aethina tumida]
MAQDVFSEMAVEPWLLYEDGYLNINTNIKEIVYHPSLNVILISSVSGIVHVLDVNSGVILLTSSLAANNVDAIKCRYIPGQDRILFTDGETIGVRSDYNGVLLLDSILQKTVTHPKDSIKLELPLTEAIILKHSLSGLGEAVEDIVHELTDVIALAQQHCKKAIKAQKWNTVCIQLPIDAFQFATSSAVNELITKNLHTPELGVASAVHERLSELLGDMAQLTDKKSMASEARRRETFSQWPHMDYKWALPDQMAQAGFYHQPNDSGDDRAMCFTCTVCLVCWERSDEPWSEHERHSPNCPFVMGEYTQNVPLSVTYATNPALDATYRGSKMSLIGDSSVPELLPVAYSDSLVSVFDVSGKLTRTHSFYVTQYDSHILDKVTLDFGTPGLWRKDKKYQLSRRITALSIVGESQRPQKAECFTVEKPHLNVRPTIICGLFVNYSPEQNLSSIAQKPFDGDDDWTMTSETKSNLYLVVYDFTYKKELDNVETDKQVDESNLTTCPQLETDVEINSFPVPNIMNLDQVLDGIDPDYLMKHIFSYKTLIPGDNNKIHIPPNVHKGHSGPRILPVPMSLSICETDSIHGNNSFSVPNFISDTEVVETSDLSISDHIKDLKSSKSQNKLNYSHSVQCISLPAVCKECSDLEITRIIPLSSNRHVLVVLSGQASWSRCYLIIYGLDFSKKMVRIIQDPTLVREIPASEKPIEINMVPGSLRLGKSTVEDHRTDSSVEGHVVTVCCDGAVRIIDLKTLKTTCYAKLESEKFVSATYCNSLERLCVSTEGGSMHFYALNETDNESLEDLEEEDLLLGLADGASASATATTSTSSASATQSTTETPDSNDTRCFNEPISIVPLSELKRLYSLCEFEQLKSPYCAVVPPCWTEVQQALRQRKHPIKMKSENDQLTKTWRLQTDATTWDEHILEITLPVSMCLGHVDVHCTIQNSPMPPQVEITLLRQNSKVFIPGIGHKRDVRFGVDESITIDMLQWVDNPIISQEYLRAHNAEILAGPVIVNDHVDLLEQTAVVTLTSPKLFRSKCRTLLLHIKSVAHKDEPKQSKQKVPEGQEGKSRNDIFRGCDWIHELSLVFYVSKPTEQWNGRVQRNLMLESNVFVQSLFFTANNQCTTEELGYVLDLLNWIAAIRLQRNRSNNGDAPNHQMDFISVVQSNLTGLIHKCFLFGGRSIAHKCMKLLMICCSGSLNIHETMGDTFNNCLLSTILQVLDSIEQVKSAAGLQWIFATVLKVVTRERERALSNKLVEVLLKITDELHKRSNPYHLLLRSRYGLYGTPMEPELFDVDLPSQIKAGSPQSYSVSSSVGESNANGTYFFENYSFNKESISAKDVLFSAETKLKCKNFAPPKIIKGLIETVPLHFVCLSASEGTRLERAESSSGSAINPIVHLSSNSSKEDIQNYLSHNTAKEFQDFQNAISSGHSSFLWDGNKITVPVLATDTDDASFIESTTVAETILENMKTTIKNTITSAVMKEDLHSVMPPSHSTSPSSMPWQQLLVAPPQQVIVVDRMHSGARRHVTLDFGQPVLLTDIVIPACGDLVSICVEGWLLSEEIDEVLLVTASDIGTRHLLLNDLQPPPLVRYIRITGIGRYGMSTTRCRIPAGYFYGHFIVLPEQVPPNLSHEMKDVTTKELEKQLAVLSNLLEDINCRYSLACSKLKDLLQPYIVSDLKNAENLFTYINVMKDVHVSMNTTEHGKIFSSYQDAINFQLQLNTVKNVMLRIEDSLNRVPHTHQTVTGVAGCSTDKLRSIAEGIVEVLLSVDVVPSLSQHRCQQLFNGLCVSQTSRLQLLTALFLDKSCGRNPFWGNFLADTIYTMFATSYPEKFPQDRLFVLLNFLSRRTPERSSVIDSALRVVSQTLQPILEPEKTLLAISIDLPLLSWLLMYLALQLDLAVPAHVTNRWSFVFGELGEKSGSDNSKGNSRKMVKSRRTIPSSGVIAYFVPNSTSAHCQAVKQYNTKLASLSKASDLLLKNEELKMMKLRLAKKSYELLRPKENVDIQTEKIRKMPQNIDKVHCQIVAKSLLQFILSMDHSSSADMMLLSFKVVARLVVIAQLQIGQLINGDQLLKLINLCISSKMPWSTIALTCFLEDAMGTSPTPLEDADMETFTSKEWFQTKSNEEVETFTEMLELFDSQAKGAHGSGSSNSNNTSNSNYPPLPSVFESDDSEFEELLEEYDKRFVKKPTKATYRTNQNVSTAIDYRLEMGVLSPCEIDIKKMLIKNTEVLFHNISATSIPVDDREVTLQPWSTTSMPLIVDSPVSNRRMLTNCFASLFENLQLQSPGHIEEVINFWLTLNNVEGADKYEPNITPKIILKLESIKSLISAMAWTSGLSLTTWCMALQTLCLVCNTNFENPSSHWPEVPGMAAHIVDHPDFLQFLLRLLSGTGLIFTGKVLAGPTLCKALNHFLVRLEVRCDIVIPTSTLGISIKNLLLKVVYQLIQPSGSIPARQGPLDVQCKLINNMLRMNFAYTDLSIAMSIFESTGVFVQNYVENVEKIKCVNIGEKQSSTTIYNNFSEIFASVLGNCENSKNDRAVSYDTLLISLLKLLGKLIETPLLSSNSQTEFMESPSATTSQTDESKAEQIQQDGGRSSETANVPCFADVVLRHHPCVIRLCHALAACKSSSLCMLVNVANKVTYTNLGEPTTVGDAVFQVLASLAKLASNRELLMEPLLMYLSQTPNLSEPLLWFILQVLENEEAVKCFFKLGGITVLAKSIVESSLSPSTIAKMGMISTVMQHFSGNSNPIEVGAISSSASASKKIIQASLENKLALVNFAPTCTIRSTSSTAQPADVLIQGLGGVTHRRARTPLWSYHFYPEETHTELILQLPSAILLREVQLQPHTIGLATCPSGVALEISSVGPSRLVPACAPIPTSGMTYIRLHLPAPKVVNCVLIRLYKPRDANSIGLLQIRLLGTTAYGQSSVDVTDDESHCRHSLGWLRLLHHCFAMPTDGAFQKQMVGCASNVPHLLSTCCGLLLVPSHILPVYMQCLEKILRELALYSPENGTIAIRMLLNNKPGIIEPLQMQTAQDRHLVNSSSDFSTCELLYQICEHQDANTYYRICVVLEWLQLKACEAIASENVENLNAIYLFCIASIFWSANHCANYDIKEIITPELFNSICSLKVITRNNNNLKYALDSLLCSMCYISPEFYPLLLYRMGILIPKLSTDHAASISDDCKEPESMTDDYKCDYQGSSEWYNHLHLGQLSKFVYDELETIALVSRSSTAIRQLLDSGFPKLLNQVIMEFCLRQTDDTKGLEKVIGVLKFFTEVCDEKVMRDWLGSEEGSSFWLPLLMKLCKKSSTNTSSLPSESLVQLEEICVKFLSKCCLCHQLNQTRLAQVLCQVISLQKNGMSGFLRRIILQLLLEYEKIPVCVTADENLYKTIKVNQIWLPSHPGIKQSHNKVMLYLSTNTTVFDILEQHVYFNRTLKADSLSKKFSRTSNGKREPMSTWFTDESDLSMAAGVTAKDKRAKDVKNFMTATPLSKKKRYASAETSTSEETESVGGRLIKCEALSDQPLALTLNLSQILKMIESQGTMTEWPCIYLSVCQSKNVDEFVSCSETSDGSSGSGVTSSGISPKTQQPFGNALQVFSAMGGLALLAQHLPAVYPEAVRFPTEKTAAEQSESDWIKVEDCDDIYEDIEETVGNNSPSKGTSIVSHIPSHSLTAFGLFLRLPGYSELLLKDMKRALCLLRLVLGVTDDGEGGDIFQSSVADSLPTLPFEILKRLYNATPLTTDDGLLLRRISIQSGVVHLLLACISIFTHHSQETTDKDGHKTTKEERTQLYWAKGTGFGTGSTQQSWNVEQALLKQRSEEEHVTVLLQVLASYINPSDKANDITKELLPPPFTELLANSKLIPVLSSYLKNDSVFDIARHIPLYKAVLQLLRAIASSSQLVNLILVRKAEEPSLSVLLKNMKTCVDTYTSKLGLNVSSNTKLKNKSSDTLEDLEQGEGLATLMPDIQETSILVAKFTNSSSDNESDREDSVERKIIVSQEERYIKVMKNLQFGSYEMIRELPDGGSKFVVSHHFESNARGTSEQSHPTRVKRIAQEAVTLSTSLPLSYSSSVFVRYDTSRLDVMKVLIIGPSDTPYANGCFELDVFFPPEYPTSPMMINLETTGYHTVRFNPNLYNDGKVCLSVLNTWHGRPEEKWNPQTSSFLQVLVSIQSLILVPEPYFNEPGYERARGTPAGTMSSKDYNLNICQATVRWAMLEQIVNPCPCFKEIIHTHFYLKKDEIIKQVEQWVKELEEEDFNKDKKNTSRATKKTPTATLENFKSNFNQLKEELNKLRLPTEVDSDISEKSNDPDEDMEKIVNDMIG